MATKTSLPQSFTPADLTGRRTLVTGGGRGIGLAIAHRLIAGGARVATPFMNTAVPGTRSGRRASMPARKSSRGRDSVRRRSFKIFRPFFQVVMTENTRPASSSGSHPPFATLMTFAPKNARSMTRKNAASAPADSAFQCQIRRYTT